MNDINIKDVISSIGTIISVIVSIYALIKASQQKSTDSLKTIEQTLTAHILKDEHDITVLNVQVEHLQQTCTTKLDTILEKLNE